MVEDIEELKPVDPNALHNRASNRNITVRKFGRKPMKHSSADEKENECDDNRAFLPGTYSIFVKTWGCSHNNSDSEYMAGLLGTQGYQIIFSDSEKKNADLWLLNSCTVKNPSEQTFVNEINNARKLNKKLVIAGCVPQGQHFNPVWESYSAVGVQQIDRIVEVVEETLKGNIVQLYGIKKEDKRKDGGAPLDMPKIRKNPLVEIVPINTGCLNNCTYCKTKHARGDLGSYHPDEICRRIRGVLEEGVVEIWLTSEDTGAYGRDLGLRLPHLLDRIIEILDDAYKNEGKEVMLRLGMTNPPHILDDLEDIARILNHERVFKFLHIPIQSASDFVLNEMKREYTQSDFRHVVEYLRDKVPNMTIATDIICGFPGETDADHEETMRLVEDYKFPVLHISQFYPRPGTPAAKMQRIPTSVVKGRSRQVTALFNSYQPYEHAKKTCERVWITDEIDRELANDDDKVKGEDDYTCSDSRISNCWVAHDIYYRQVLIPKVKTHSESLLGCACDVEIIRTGKFFLVGKIVSEITQANQSRITSEVLLQRTGKNNRSVKAKKVLNMKNAVNKPSFGWRRLGLWVLMCFLVVVHLISSPYLAEFFVPNNQELKQLKVIRIPWLDIDIQQTFSKPSFHFLLWVLMWMTFNRLFE